MINNNKTYLQCLQINLQRSKLSISQLCEAISRLAVDVVLIQKSFTVNNKVAGFPNYYRIYEAEEHRQRAAILLTNNDEMALLMRQFSVEDFVCIEVNFKNVIFKLVSVYFSTVIL